MSYAYSSRRANSSKRSYNKNFKRPQNKKRVGKYIDPIRFVNPSIINKDEVYTNKHTFADFKLHSLLHKNLVSKNYKIPSPIQDQTIPLGLEGRDIVGIASTGTGKTAAFAIPVINKIMNDNVSSALIIAPTRELAQQIQLECEEFTKGSYIKSTLIIGGANMNVQLRNLRKRPRIIIGTPGRIKDHIGGGSIKLHNCSMVVLDEVDRMLDMGFITDVRSILSEIKKPHQSFYFSATLDDKIRQLITTFTNDAKTIMLQPSSTSDNVDQDVVRYSGTTEKIDKLHTALIHDSVSKAIVFENTKRGVDRLNKELKDRGFSSDSIHGGKTQGQRQKALDKFKKSEVKILVATDVAARGIDVIDITHVINYSIPESYNDYIHRVGRAGRAGNTGFALTFVDKDYSYTNRV